MPRPVRSRRRQAVAPARRKTRAPPRSGLADARGAAGGHDEILRVMAARRPTCSRCWIRVANRPPSLCRCTLRARAPRRRRSCCIRSPTIRVDGDAAVAGARGALAAGPPSAARATLDRKTVHHADVVPLLDGEYPDARENATRNWISRGPRRSADARRRRVRRHHSSTAASPDCSHPIRSPSSRPSPRQAAIAIENVRLFHATTGSARAADGDQRNPARDQPVADRRAAGVRDHRGRRARAVRRRITPWSPFDGELIRIGGSREYRPEGADALRAAYPAGRAATAATQRVIHTGRVVTSPMSSWTPTT